MPESLNADGTKAVKGEFGFRYGASVPRPMLMDFTQMPKDKVDLSAITERQKDGMKSEAKKRLQVPPPKTPRTP